MTPKIRPICGDPKKYPQNLHTPQFFFLKAPKNIEIQNFKFKKNNPSLRMYKNFRVPPPPPGTTSSF